MPLAAILVGLALILGGVVALIKGLRGRRVDDHPCCRRCGFDLTGRPAESIVCSECGADLRRADAIRIGHRQKRPGLLTTGTVLLLLPAAALVAMALQFDWIRIEPLWLLTSNATSSTATTRNAAISEINRRWFANELSAKQVDALVLKALALQADTSIAWDGHWGDWIDRQMIAGKLSDSLQQQYAEHVNYQSSLIVRPTLPRDGELPIQFSHLGARVGTQSPLALNFSSIDRVILVDGQPLPNPDHVGSSSSYGTALCGNGASGTNLDLRAALPKLKDGKHTLRLEQTYSIRTSFASNAVQLTRFTLAQSADFELLPPGQTGVKLKPDPKLLAPLQSTMKVRDFQIHNRTASTSITVEVSASPLPAGVGFDVLACSGGKEWKIGSVAWPAGTTNAAWSLSGSTDPSLAKAGKADIVLRASPSAAGNTVNVFDIWDGSVTYKNVPVKIVP